MGLLAHFFHGFVKHADDAAPIMTADKRRSFVPRVGNAEFEKI